MISLALSLSIAGPRAGLLNTQRWPMALRLAVGYDADGVDDADRARLIEAALNMQFALDAQQAIHVTVRSTGATTGHLSTATRPAAAAGGFIDALKAEIVATAKSRAPQLTVAFAGAEEFTDDDVTTARQPWPALAQTLSSMPSTLSAALGAIWFFEIDRAWLVDALTGELLPGVKISASLESFDGHALQFDPVSSNDHGRYADLGGNCTAACNWLPLEPQLAPPLEALVSYWQPVRSAELDSLENLDRWLLDALDGPQLFRFLGRTSVAKSLNQKLDQFDQARFDALVARAALVFKPAVDIADVLDALKAAAPGADVRALLRDQLHDRLRARFVDTVAPVPVTGDVERLRDYCAQAIPDADPIARPVLPGEGIALCLGVEELRLLHENSRDAALRDAADDIAGALLFGRRASDEAQLGTSPWQLLTAAQLEVSDPANLPNTIASPDQPTPLTLVYQNGVLRGDESYRGESMVAKSLLQDVHRQDFDLDEDGFGLAAIAFKHARHQAARALPLRYGDHYEFASSVVDGSGCHAAECSAGRPWLFDFERLQQLRPPLSAVVQFRRRVAVGECNLAPQDSASGWPAMPADVVPACRAADAVDNAPTVLLVPATASYTGTHPQSYRVKVSRPRIDEQTWLRWSMLRTDHDPLDKPLAVQALRRRLVEIYTARDGIMAADTVVAGGDQRSEADKRNDDAHYLPFDPAVSGIGVRVTRSDGTRTVRVEMGSTITFSAHIDGLAGVPATSLAIGPGEWLKVEFLTLVAVADFDARFDADAMDGLVEAMPIIDDSGTAHRAFAASPVFFECASDAMPNAVRLYDALKLRTRDNQDIDIVIEGASTLPLFDRVVSASIRSERWMWRNRPLPWNPSALDSRPPSALYNEATRDTDPQLDVFDTLAAPDHGFAVRARVKREIVRGQRGEAGMENGDCLVHRDVRDGQLPGDYLRYGLSLRSRYAGVLQRERAECVAQRADGRWFRRVTADYRGDPSRVPVPRVLAVLPLTRKLSEDPRGKADSQPTTPFLVILDEIAYREFGIGERLLARVSLVKKEIGDDESARPFRFGALPDRHLVPGPFKDIAASDASEAVEPKLPLTCFGPFGFSLERSNDQALANASAWVVFAPRDTPPDFNLFMELRRSVDAGVHVGSSPWSAALPLYTYAGSDDLVARTDGALEITTQRSIAASALRLQPHVGGRELARRAYRYVLLLGNLAGDGGRGVEVFVPHEFAWVSTPTDGQPYQLVSPDGADATRWPQHTHGVVLEVLLNGHYPQPTDAQPRTAPLDHASTLQDLLRRMLAVQRNPGDAALQDAQGMLRRCSPHIALHWG